MIGVIASKCDLEALVVNDASEYLTSCKGTCSINIVPILPIKGVKVSILTPVASSLGILDLLLELYSF